MAECPHINREITPNPLSNQRKNYLEAGGSDYVYWEHDDGFGHRFPCQFCEFIGRKRDIFECFNESEWQRCWVYLLKGASDG